MSDGIEILVEMAKKGKIDPWNINLVDVTDQYLAELALMKSNNLQLTGKTLFFAAVLLRIKSDILEGLTVEPPNIYDDLHDDYDHDEYDHTQDFSPPLTGVDNPIKRSTVSEKLEHVLKRRSSVKLHRSRNVTLEDLLEHLKRYEELEKKRSTKERIERIEKKASYTHFTPEDIINLAHDEFIEEQVKSIEMVLEKLFEQNTKIKLEELTNNGISKSTAYISLLFLSSRTNIDLIQDNFYSDLYIAKGEKEAYVPQA